MVEGDRAGTQGRNLEARADADTMEKCCLLTCSQWLLGLLHYTVQDHLPWGAQPTMSGTVSKESRKCL